MGSYVVTQQQMTSFRQNSHPYSCSRPGVVADDRTGVRLDGKTAQTNSFVVQVCL